jgi:type IV pilus assembly protein PilO
MTASDRSGIRPVYLVIIATLVMAIGWFTLVAPRQQSLDRMIQEELYLKQQLDVMQRKTANMDAYQAQLLELQMVQYRLIQHLPNILEYDEIVKQWRQYAHNHGLTLVSVTFARERLKEFYTQQPFKLTVRGSFAEVHNFLYDHFYAEDIAVDLRDFTLVKHAASGELVLSIDGNLYRYLEDLGL